MALSEIQNENSFYDFITAIKDIDSIFTDSYKMTLKEKISRNINILSIFNLIKIFRNHI